MYDLSFYQLLVDVRSFADVKDSVAEYYESPNRNNIANLFLDLTAGKNNSGNMTMQQAITYYNSAAKDICLKFGVKESEIPICQAYLFPYDFKPSNEDEIKCLIEKYENAISIAVDENEDAWYLREDLKNRLMNLYFLTGDTEKLKAVVADAKTGRKQYNEWLAKAR